MTLTAKQTTAKQNPANRTKKQNTSARTPATAGPGRAVSAANAFPKSVRLLKHARFQHVYETGRKHFSASMIFFYLLREGALPLSPPGFRSEAGERVGNAQSTVQIGLTVGRALGGAVDRNRIKRRMRDVVRHELNSLQDKFTARGVFAEIVINPKKIALTADIAKLREEVQRGFAVVTAANLPGATSAK
jgi:ribonuclease P protein component